VLFDSRLGMGLHQELDVRGNVHRADLLERKFSALTPTEKISARDEVRATSIQVADVRGEEFQEA